jgi:integrase
VAIRKKGTRWEVRVRAGAGRRIEQRLPAGATRADAQALEAAIRKRLVGAASGRIDYTLIEAIDRWLPDAQRLRSWQKDLRFRLAVVRDLVGHYQLSQLTDAADRIKRQGGELSVASVNRYLAIVKRLGSLAYKWGWIDQPLAQRIELLPGERRRTEYATPAQLRRLLAAADHRLRDAILLAALTGLRRGELLAVTPQMIDRGALILPAALTKTGQARVVPLPAEALPIVARLPIQLGPQNLYKLWRQAREAAGMPTLRWHDLRRSYGTWLLQSGASLADVRDLLGHGDVKTTSIYLSTARQDLDKAVAKLPTVGEARGKTKPVKTGKKAA